MIILPLPAETLSLATKSALSGAATYGADVAVTVVVGRLGVVAPQSLVDVPLAPSKLCDALAPGGAATVFFAGQLGAFGAGGGSGGSVVGAAAKATAGAGFTAGGQDEVTFAAKYVDGKQCLVAEEGGSGVEGTLKGMEPTAKQLEAEVAAQAEVASNSSDARSAGKKKLFKDPFLRGEALATRVADMSLAEPTGPGAAGRVASRIVLPPAPADSKDIRKFGAKCLESQVCGSASRSSSRSSSSSSSSSSSR
jgi:hypothetical protein